MISADSPGPGEPQHILSIESRFSPYFEKLICGTDILARLQPLVQKTDAMAKRRMTPDTQRRLEAELAELWRGIMAGLPPEHRPPFSATEFASAIRDGQMDRQRLAQDVVQHVGRVCPERLQELRPDAVDRQQRLRQYLTAMFNRLVHQSEYERQTRVAQEQTRVLLDRFYRLSDLLAAARTAKARDVYAEQDAQAIRHDEKKNPYRLSMPERHRSTCKSGEHRLPTIRYTLVNPAWNERAELMEADIHEVLEHGAGLPPMATAFLERLGEAQLSQPSAGAPAPLALTLVAAHDPARGVRLDITIANRGRALFKLCLEKLYVQLRSNGTIEVALSCHERGQGDFLAPGAERTHTLWLEFGQTLPVLDRGGYELNLSVRSDVDDLRAHIAQSLEIQQPGLGARVQQVVEHARAWLRANKDIAAFEGEPPPAEGGDKRTRVNLGAWSMGNTHAHWELAFSNHGPDLFGSTSVSVAKQGDAAGGTIQRIQE